MDTAASGIRAAGSAPGRDGDSPVLPDLPDRTCEDEDIGTATADGASDGRRCHGAIIARAGSPIIPIRRNGRPPEDDRRAAPDIVLGPRADDASPRSETLGATRRHGRAFRHRRTGYDGGSRAEAGTRGLASSGERIAAGDPDRRTAAIPIRAALRNRFDAPGTAAIVRVAWT